MRLPKLQGYVGCEHPNHHRVPAVIVLGNEFGPQLIAVHCNLADAVDEYDERFGDEVDFTDSALEDYEGETIEERTENAMMSGEMRVTGQGKFVWVSHYETWTVFETKTDFKEWVSQFDH